MNKESVKKFQEIDEKIGNIIQIVAITITAATVERVVIKFLKSYLLNK